MCNRYLLAALDAAKQALDAIIETPFNPGDLRVHPLGKGAVVRIVDRARIMTGMTWGFPLSLKGKHGQPLKPKPVNNARTDKLQTGFWHRWTTPPHRCLIPLTAWAEAEGQRGRMTETWLSVPDVPVIAAAGLWRPTDQWGDCYTMVMTESAGEAARVHDRMPVLLNDGDQQRWLDASLDQAMTICRPWSGEVQVDRTDSLWAGRR